MLSLTPSLCNLLRCAYLQPPQYFYRILFFFLLKTGSMILCAGKVIYGIFGFKWVLHQLNLQILKSSFRSSSLTHRPYYSIYKYKFGTDNHPCKTLSPYLCWRVLCKWIEASPAKNSRHRWSCLSTNGAEPRMRNGAAYLEDDGSGQQRTSSQLHGSCSGQGICKKAFWELNSSWP